MDRILIDTDVLIDFTKGKSDVLLGLLDKQRGKKVKLYINPVIVAEFLTDESLKDNKKKQKAYSFLNYFETLSVSKKMGLLAGEYLRKRVTSTLGDAFISATCVEGGLLLATRNKRHFKKVPKLKFYS